MLVGRSRSRMSWRQWAAIAGVAWLVGFAQYVIGSLALGLDLGTMAFGFAIYGLWALLLGFVLIWRPSRPAVVVSAILGALVTVVYMPMMPMPSISPPYWLSWLPEAIATVASVIALVAGRRDPSSEPRKAVWRRSKGGPAVRAIDRW